MTNEDEKIPTIDYREYYPPQGRCMKRILNAGDSAISLFLISPLAIVHWQGTWAYMDRKMEYFPPWNCFILGMIIHTTIALLREFLYENCRKSSQKQQKTKCGQVLRFFLTKLYLYVFSMGCNMHWRGGWAVLDMYFGTGWKAAWLEMWVCFIPLVIFKSVRNLLAPPFVVLADSKDMSYQFPTRYRTESSKQPGLYILDCSFSVLIIGTLVVFAWRGLWILCDLSIYPEDPSMSAFGSLIIGYGIVAITFSLQSLMRWTCERLQGVWRVAAADIFLFFSFIGTINVWRGVWNLCDIYFMPENKLLSNIITHTASFLLLALLNCSNSVLVRGVYIDAEEPNGQCVIFPVYYIRLFFQKERTKKQKRLMDALEKLDENNVSLLPEKRAGIKIPIIVKSSSNHQINVNSNNEKKALELSDILMNDDVVENINETTKLKHTSNNELNMAIHQDDNDNDNDENLLTKCEKNNTSD